MKRNVVCEMMRLVARKVLNTFTLAMSMKTARRIPPRYVTASWGSCISPTKTSILLDTPQYSYTYCTHDRFSPTHVELVGFLRGGTRFTVIQHLDSKSTHRNNAKSTKNIHHGAWTTAFTTPKSNQTMCNSRDPFITMHENLPWS